MTNTEKVKVDAVKTDEPLDDFYSKDTDYCLEGEFKPFGVTDET